VKARARRRFLGGVAAAAGSATAANLGLIRRALALPAERRSGTLHDVQHVVVLTQENRSFDHYFGALNGVRGFADPFPIPLSGGRTVWQQPRAASRRTKDAASGFISPFRLDTVAHFELMRAEGTPHRWPDAQQAWDHGRMGHWPAAKRNHAMAHFAPADLPFQTALADAFTLCDAYHCSFQGGTHPNRLFLDTGSNDPSGHGRGPALYNDFEDFGPALGPGSELGYTWTTYAERLQDAGVSWQVYQDLDDNFGDNSLAAFRRFRDAFHGRSRGDEALRERAGGSGGLDRLRRDVLAGRLPAVSWVVGTAEGSEHPWKSSPAQGADYSARVLEALTAHPEVWRRTVLFINYDENDGWFDHLPPPAPPSLLDMRGRFAFAGSSTVDTTGEYHLRLPAGHDGPEDAALLGRPYGLGPRVPMFVVSPWSRGGYVCSEVFDHSSVIRFIEARFGVHEPSISAWRRAVCGDLTSAFDFGRQQAARVFLPDTQARAQRARSLPGTTLPAPPDQVAAPRQAAGARPARPLRYALHAQCTPAREGGLTLSLDNRGAWGAVLHAYDPRRPERLPRRYTLGAGQRASEPWPGDEDGSYALWLFGPNGWHRRFAGQGGPGEPTAQLWVGPGARALRLRLANPGPSALAFELRALAYVSDAPRELFVAAGATRQIELALESHHWYDWQLSLPAQLPWLRRFAGHVETGQASLTDPAMHGPAPMTLAQTSAPRPAPAAP
jgi:phospholipase C